MPKINLHDELSQALRYDERGEISEAVACLDGILRSLPEAPAYQKLVGQLYQRLGEDEKSLALIMAAMEQTPDDPDLHLCLGYHNIDNSMLEIAAENFNAALSLDPSLMAAQLYLGRTQGFLGDLANAEKSLIKAIALDPGELEPHIQLAHILLSQNKFDQAHRKFSQADEMAPGNRMAEIGLKRVNALSTSRVKTATNAQADPATVACVKQGTKYGPEYVNRLQSMARRNSEVDLRFVCFTDNPKGLADGIEARPLPDTGFQGWWNKVSLFSDDLADIGEKFLYFDLDVVLTGNIDQMLRYDSDFVIMDNDYVPGFNTSVFLLKTGSRPDVRANFSQAIADEYDGDQDWVAVTAPDAELWPDMWCVPYRLRAVQRPPAITKVVVFSGRPNPEDYPSEWIRTLWR